MIVGPGGGCSVGNGDGVKVIVANVVGTDRLQAATAVAVVVVGKHIPPGALQMIEVSVGAGSLTTVLVVSGKHIPPGALQMIEVSVGAGSMTTVLVAPGKQIPPGALHMIEVSVGAGSVTI